MQRVPAAAAAAAAAGCAGAPRFGWCRRRHLPGRRNAYTTTTIFGVVVVEGENQTQGERE